MAGTGVDEAEGCALGPVAGTAGAGAADLEPNSARVFCKIIELFFAGGLGRKISAYLEYVEVDSVHGDHECY